VRVRSVALWRMEFGLGLFGEVQTLVHTGSDVAICREIQKGAWAWAESEWGPKAVTKANGKEQIESPDEARWLVRAQDAVYGYDVCMGMVDEGWDVKTDTVTEGLEPATIERSSPQLHLTSTAHRRATSLMRTELAEALTIEVPTTLLLLWAAPPNSDPGDPTTWRAASPHWSEARHRYVAKKYEKALAGEQDPEFDDPDPMAGFLAQYLNVWPLRESRAQRGVPVVTEDQWGDLTAERPDTTPRAVAIEGWPGAGCSVAFAWRRGDRAVVTTEGHAELASAVAAVRAAGYRGTVTIGASLAEDPALKRLRTKPRNARTGTAVSDLVRRLAEDAVRHDGNIHLTTQLLAVRTLDGADGLRMASTHRADAVKAASWAIEASRGTKPARRGIVLPTSATA
jgi:hypothetical protein